MTTMSHLNDFSTIYDEFPTVIWFCSVIRHLKISITLFPTLKKCGSDFFNYKKC